MKRYSLTETAGLIRQALRSAFPNTAFSVRSKRYAGGCSITAHWTDGPTTKQVSPILNKFEGSGFDGMQDLKYSNPHSEFKGEPCEFAADYVFSCRHESPEAIRAAAFRAAFECDLPLLEVDDCGTVKGGRYQIAFSFSPASENHYKRDLFCSGVDSRIAGGEWYEQLVYQVARATSYEETAASPALPHMVTESYIAEKVREMIQ